jgi:hypothetical protein
LIRFISLTPRIVSCLEQGAAAVTHPAPVFNYRAG